VDFLETQGEMEEAAVQLAMCVNDDGFFSPQGKQARSPHLFINSFLSFYLDLTTHLFLTPPPSLPPSLPPSPFQVLPNTPSGCVCATCAPSTPPQSPAGSKSMPSSGAASRASRTRRASYGTSFPSLPPSLPPSLTSALGDLRLSLPPSLPPSILH